MNKLQIFNNPEFGEIRTVEVGGKPYAVGVDVARALEYAKPSQAVIDHCKGIRKLGIPSGRGEQETNIIPEGDIYRLIVKAADQSKNAAIKNKAEKFERWVFDEVLPTIRATGRYEAAPTKQRLGEYNAAARLIRATLKDAGMAPEYVAVAVRTVYAPVGIHIPLDGITAEKRTFDCTAIAKKIGMFSKSGKPHDQAVGAITRILNISDEHKTLVPFQDANSGHSGPNVQYDEYAVQLIEDYVKLNDYPQTIHHGGKNYSVQYAQ